MDGAGSSCIEMLPTCEQADIRGQLHDSAAEKLQVLQTVQLVEELGGQLMKLKARLLRGSVLHPKAEVRQSWQPQKGRWEAARL